MEILREQRVRVVLMTSNPMDWTNALEKRYPEGPFLSGPKAGNRFLELYVDTARRVAQEEGVPLVDIYAAFKKIKEKEENALTEPFLGDGVHPNTEGYRLVSRLLTGLLEKSMLTPGVKTTDTHALRNRSFIA